LQAKFERHTKRMRERVTNIDPVEKKRTEKISSDPNQLHPTRLSSDKSAEKVNYVGLKK
jgi:hypothetical protein